MDPNAEPAVDATPLPPIEKPGPTPAATIVCDLAEAHAFGPSGIQPSVPVLTAFGDGRLHQYYYSSNKEVWDLERAAADVPEALFRSTRYLNANNQGVWSDLAFRFASRAFLLVDHVAVRGYAETAPEAERLVQDFRRRYTLAASPTGGCFELIRTEGGGIRTESVQLETVTVLTPEVLALHYGEEGMEWHRWFAGRLRGSTRGLCILEGSPGTGKTSYLRHLMGELKDTHRFYFLPPASLEVLSDPNFIGFWAVERRQHEEHQFVAVLEDADAALMTRGADNRNQVSTILNLTDGMLGDFLRVQIICTINCRATDLDPALLRPGRLLCHRVFDRMDGARARRLAAHLGRPMPAGTDFSLAEVYAGDGQSRSPQAPPRLGFK